jgi:hypothetical protein
MAVGDVPLTPIIDTVTGTVTEIGRIFLRTLAGAVNGLAPIDAAYWTSRSASVLSAEVNLGALASGYLKIATAIGIATPTTVATIPQADVTGLTAALAGKAAAAHHTTHEPGGSDAITALSAATLTSGTLPDARLSANVPLVTLDNTFTSPRQTIAAANPQWRLSDVGQPLDAKVFRLINQTQTLRVDALNDAMTTVSATPLSLDRLGNAKVGADLYEKGRVTPIGHWIDVPFSAADFSTPTAGATFVVTGVAVFAYALVGKTAMLALVIGGTATITGAPVRLRVQLPAALVPNRTGQGQPFTYYAGGVPGTGLCALAGTQLDLLRDVAGTTFPAGASFFAYLNFPISIA